MSIEVSDEKNNATGIKKSKLVLVLYFVLILCAALGGFIAARLE